MRIESSVTSISWIPIEAVEGLAGVAFDVGFAHYDLPPRPVLEDLDAMRKADRFRFANELRAWVEVVDGGIVNYGHLGQGYLGSNREVELRPMTYLDSYPSSDGQRGVI
jgi:hypothetical protein